MRKLKLESLTVESFDTTAAASASRGTVLGHDVTGHNAPSLCKICGVSDAFACTDSIEQCGNTAYLDCTLACTDFASCLGDC